MFDQSVFHSKRITMLVYRHSLEHKELMRSFYQTKESAEAFIFFSRIIFQCSRRIKRKDYYLVMMFLKESSTRVSCLLENRTWLISCQSSFPKCSRLFDEKLRISRASCITPGFVQRLLTDTSDPRGCRGWFACLSKDRIDFSWALQV